MRGLVRYERAPVEQMRGATRTAVENLVVLALKKQVTAVLLTGDVYDGTWRDFNTGLFFTGQMARLQESDIPVFMIPGNHDAENKMTMELSLPGNVHRFHSDVSPRHGRLPEATGRKWCRGPAGACGRATRCVPETTASACWRWRPIMVTSAAATDAGSAAEKQKVGTEHPLVGISSSLSAASSQSGWYNSSWPSAITERPAWSSSSDGVQIALGAQILAIPSVPVLASVATWTMSVLRFSPARVSM